MTWRVAGINFDHMHMGDNLRMVHEHPDAEIVGLCDLTPARMQSAANEFSLSPDCLFEDVRECIERASPEIVILMPRTAGHREWVERIAPLGVHVILEKPFAATLADADAMIATMAESGQLFAINWPMAWYPGHCTAKRLIDEGTIGDLLEVHYYDGNRGPLYHLADKVAVPEESARRAAAESWFYQRQAGGGSLLDYLGYGTTLGTWFQNGRMPLEVTTVVDHPAGLDVDEHSLTIARYEHGLSKFETRWGTFTDPWVHQPQPKCGFVLVGTDGTISSYDLEPTIRVQTRSCLEGQSHPVDALAAPCQNPIQYVIHCLENDAPVEGLLSPATSRQGQVITEAAILSAQEKRAVAVAEVDVRG